MEKRSSVVTAVSPTQVKPNPNNPRRFFNEKTLDLLRTSIKEVGILVPLIVYEDPEETGTFILLDGERRWTCALDLGLDQVPVNTIPAPTRFENLLRMFNIHAVRDEWPLISIALSLQDVIKDSGEERETRLAELTGLSRGTVRRAKRLLTLPLRELALIRSEAHLERAAQIHREDLYLEVLDAVAAIERELPELADQYGREKMIRQLVKKREEGKLTAVTDFRHIPKLLRSVQRGEVDKKRARDAIKRVIDNVAASPFNVIERASGGAFHREDLQRRASGLLGALEEMDAVTVEEGDLRETLTLLQSAIDRLLRR